MSADAYSRLRAPVRAAIAAETAASKHNLEEVLELAQRNLVTIYGMSTVGFGFNSEGEKNLSRLTEETGGRRPSRRLVF